MLGTTVLLMVLLQTPQQTSGTVSGFVKDAMSGEPIAFASVYLEAEAATAVSGQNGYYVLGSIPAGNHTIVFSVIGYRRLEKTIFVGGGESVRLDVRLQSEPIQMSEVIVTAKKARFKKEIDIGVRPLELKDLKIAPGLIEQDLFRSLQMLPGVVTVSDFSSALYIRGGSPDQNLVLLDGVTVYNPYHLGGLFSTFSLDALKGAELHSGTFPADYGNAVSSVLDVEMKQGNSERFEGKADISLLSSKLVFEGPIPKGSFLVSGRRTYIDALTYAISKFRHDEDIHFPYYFYDLQSKVNFDLSEKNRLTVSGFFGDDVISIDESDEKLDFRWGNYTVGLKWRWIVTPKILSTLLLTKGRYRVSLADVYGPLSSKPIESKIRMGIGDVSAKEDVTFFPNRVHTLKVGWEGKLLDINNWLSEDTTVFANSHQKPEYFAMYLSDKWQLSPVLLLNIGIRGEYFSIGKYFRASPRLGAKYFLSENLALKAGWGQYCQFLSIPFPGMR